MITEDGARNGRWLGFALATSAFWFGVLCAALAVEHTPFGEWLFGVDGPGYAYLALQLLLTVAALATCSVVLIRGPARARWLVVVPTVALVIYGLMFLAGEG